MTNRTDLERQDQYNGAAEDGYDDYYEYDDDYELEPLEVPIAIALYDLAELMETTPVEVIKEFMRNGYMFPINEVVQHDLVAQIAPSFGFEVLPLEEESDAGSIVPSTDDDDPEMLEDRPPVVTILGHVDHGKTTLLDTIRKTNVVDGEAGGITQHIGAYQVNYDNRQITFLDTPGHEAFTAMRARGAQVTDIAVLVVAADDGIMPQTEEAISHVKAAGVPIVVAINKVDRPEADPERVKRQLAERDLLIEEWGGDVIALPVSALTGDGVDNLLDNLAIVAEVSEFKANVGKTARAVVVEARIDRSRGTVATVLVQTGTLSVGDNIVIGSLRGRIRAMLTDSGQPVEVATPSQPVEILGIAGVPEAGDILEVTEDEKAARQLAEQRIRQSERQRAAGPTLEDVHTRIAAGEVKALNLIIKTDVQGTVEAVKGALNGLNTDQTRVNIVHIASGAITESDVLLGLASQAIIIGFNTEPGQGATALANQEGVEIRHYNIIYHLLEDVERALTGLLEPVYRDVTDGHATVRAVFGVGRRMRVAGFYVNDGQISRGSTVHVLRGGQKLFEGNIASLKHFRDDVREVNVGFEGGLTLDGFNDYQEGDILEAHSSERVR
ncbi:MAG: translation initiation factor IF-2 [Chloroflexi bacterium]|nr:translation initiation factor IF-2 [Chloroflexota bacterium]